MSYLFDIYYAQCAPQKNLLYMGLYITLFPQLIAGPIVRYNQISEEITCRESTKEDITQGIARFVTGLAKKALIANYMARLADNTFILFGQSQLSVMTVWLGAIAYSLQIYFDFSGYFDMAIGIGRIFGFHFCDNFNYPYISKSVTEFWRRWHISLSTWFRDYVYIPLGGNRVKKSLWVRNLFIVWLLTGIWHGANWTFIAWGLFYFVLLLLEKTTGFTKKLGPFARAYTLIAVILAWVLFRSDSLSEGLRYIGCMFGFNASSFADETFLTFIRETKWVLIAGIVFSAPVIPAIEKWLSTKSDKLKDVCESLYYFVPLSILSLLAVVGSSYNPFIYFNF